MAARTLTAPRGLWSLLPVLLAAFGGCGGESPAPDDPPAAVTAASGYPAARARAVAWLDDLSVDVAELREHGVAGIKKLAEALEAYAILIRQADDPVERERFLARARALAAQTRDPAYHDLANYDDVEFSENSMSYFRVAWLMDELGLDTTGYREQLERNRPRMDAHMPERGAWQRRMFARFYDHFGLEKPGELILTKSRNSILTRRVPLADLQPTKVFRMMKAIPTAEVCTKCHGTDIQAPVVEKLDELYPEDKARGYSVGDLRGAFTLKKTL